MQSFRERVRGESARRLPAPVDQQCVCIRLPGECAGEHGVELARAAVAHERLLQRPGCAQRHQPVGMEKFLVCLCARWESVANYRALTFRHRPTQSLKNSNNYVSAELAKLRAIEGAPLAPDDSLRSGPLESNGNYRPVVFPFDSQPEKMEAGMGRSIGHGVPLYTYEANAAEPHDARRDLGAKGSGELRRLRVRRVPDNRQHGQLQLWLRRWVDRPCPHKDGSQQNHGCGDGNSDSHAAGL